MPLSKTILPAKEAKERAFEFVPPKLDRKVPSAALSIFEGSQEKRSDFRLSEAIKVKTGISDVEKGTFEEEVEKKTLERLKDVQEGAYKEAFQLGLIEGRKQAFEQSDAEIKEKLSALDELMSSMASLKKDLLAFNETHLVKLVFHMAERLAHREIQINPETVVEVLRQAVEKAQSEQEILVQVNPEQIQFIEELKKETAREFEFLKKVKIQANETISLGGCIIETNYGEIDSRFEERVGKLWESLVEILPRTKDKVSAA